jgi:hypothetical protein
METGAVKQEVFAMMPENCDWATTFPQSSPRFVQFVARVELLGKFAVDELWRMQAIWRLRLQ